MLISENGGNFMALSKKPVTGMKDIQPAEMQIRDYVIGKMYSWPKIQA